MSCLWIHSQEALENILKLVEDLQMQNFTNFLRSWEDGALGFSGLQQWVQKFYAEYLMSLLSADLPNFEPFQLDWEKYLQGFLRGYLGMFELSSW